MKLLSLAQSRSQSRAESAALVLGFSILMGLLAQVSAPLPFTPVPVTGQTLGVLLAGVLLGGPRAAAAMLLYLGQGLAGLPVFALGSGGLAPLLGLTGGYLLSYPFAAFVVGYLATRRNGTGGGGLRGKARLLAALLCGEIVIFFCGTAWLGALMPHSPVSLLQAAVWPFLPGEVLKVALVLSLASVLGGVDGGEPQDHPSRDGERAASARSSSSRPAS